MVQLKGRKEQSVPLDGPSACTVLLCYTSIYQQRGSR